MVSIERECYINPWTIDHFTYESNNPHSFSFVILNENNTVCGYSISHHILDQLFMLNISVGKIFRRRGLANLMIQNIFKFCLKERIKYIDLEVRESNLIAQNLYSKNGFTIIGKRKRFYSDGETAILMKKIM
jgi:ribosomal-protein-alanine N-acetyltransferase